MSDDWSKNLAEGVLRGLLPPASPSGRYLWREDGHADPGRVRAAAKLLAMCVDNLGEGFPAPPRVLPDRTPPALRDLAVRYGLLAHSRMLIAGDPA